MPFGTYSLLIHGRSHHGSHPTLPGWPVQSQPIYHPSYDRLPNEKSAYLYANYGNHTPPPSTHTASSMATPDADEMEQFQRLSDQYQADLPASPNLQTHEPSLIDL
jgi:hypothetical protein